MSEQPQQGSSSQVLPNGSVVDGRYEIKGLLGRGGFATVYEAHHVHMGRQAAVKILDASRALEDRTYAERFLREARIASSVLHPHVVTIYDFGFHGDQPYIAMERLEGHDLSREIRRNGPLTPERALRLFLPCLEALDLGHRAGVVHKDLKPANLFINAPGTDDEKMLVLDFGIARVEHGEAAAGLTGTGELMGTPRYLAPEYVKQQIVTPAVDVYQMALILSEALTGKTAAEGTAYTAMMAHCTGNLRIPHILLNGPVGQVFKRAIAIDYQERYGDCGEFMRALKGVEEEFKALPPTTDVSTASEAYPVDTGRVVDNTDRTPSPFSAGVNTNQQARPSSARLRSLTGGNRRLFLIGGAIAAVLVFSVVGWLVTRSDEEASAPAEEDEPESVVDTPEPALEQEPTTPESAEPAEGYARLLFVTTPAGAEVYIDGEERGETPIEIDLEEGREVVVEMVLPGYVGYMTTVVPEADGDPVIATLTQAGQEEDVDDPMSDELVFDGDGAEGEAGATGEAGAAANAASAGDTNDAKTSPKTKSSRSKPRSKTKKRRSRDDDDKGSGYRVAP